MSADKEPENYEDTPQGQHQRWVVEFAAARKPLEKWHEKGDEIDKEFRNETPSPVGTEATDFDARLPLFTSDILTISAMLLGQAPKCDVSRLFGDSDDDLGRVAGEILERILNTDISREDDDYSEALKCCLMDFFLPGFALAMWRYDAGEIVEEDVGAKVDPTGRVLVEAYKKTTKPKEKAEVDYVHWKDVLWGPSKVLHQVPWWAIRKEMTRSQLVARFGETGKLVPLEKRKDGSEDPWSRASIWEVYEKATRKVYWFCESYIQTLDTKPDPLGLEGFFPFPRKPLVSGLTTSKVVPRPYYALHQDQYRQINMLISRIREQVDAIRVSGACSKEDWETLQRILQPSGRGKLIPLANFNGLVEKGGVAGAVSWFPLKQHIETIVVLMQQLNAEIDLLHQTTGFSDIMRGEATQAGATATEQRAKTRFGSVRIQRLQDQIAEFATDLLRIKGEIVCKHYAPETIFERANVRFMPEADRALAMQAIELLKSDFACYRIQVKPEAVALADFAAMKQERAETLETLTMFFQAMAPIVSAAPDSAEDMLELGKWMVAGVRGASQAEGTLDRMIAKAKAAAEQAKQNPQAAPPNPQVQAEEAKRQTLQMKGALDIQKEQAKAQLQQQQAMVEVQADAMREANQRTENVKEAAQRQMVANVLRPPQMPGNGVPK